jgi:hypothetical protein
MNNKKDLDDLITEVILENSFYLIKLASKLDIEEISKFKIHKIYDHTTFIYDKKALLHFQETLGSKNKTRRLWPRETIEIILKPDEILPNFIKGKDNSYLYIKNNKGLFLCIIEIIENGKSIRVTHGGFEVKDKKYLQKERELKKSILEGRHSLISR